ncbi:CopD family protein [Nocardia brasiliensis]|uniref:Copper resistance D domain-containing protein n=1 Tax=Nocardia brasiliensis (strain ATCC 700358 / HUJEG-1) TaxID=1133849 RepID=K0EKK9_NOCB7|nr:CopD family protein [Nocardia brasiliensis]AFT98026.1 copper resistance D domain-containing protein [Nocardia brasiliensis ATCC 700358]OCF90729.1 copper resistance protein CopD [Nocardia brasiliensis]
MTGKTRGGGARRDTAGAPWPVLLIVPAGLLGVLLAWALSLPAGFAGQSVARVLADGAGAVVLGLAALPRVHAKLSPPWRLLAVLAGFWCGTEFAVLVAEAAEVLGVPVGGLGAGSFGDYLLDVSGGQVGIAILLGAGAIACYAALAFRRIDIAAPDLVLVFAAVTLALRPITGHMSQHAFGSVLAAVHALAAAAWFGLLVALALVVRTRGTWAVALPRYSAMALPLVAIVAVTGLLNGLIKVGGITPFFDTGYGRILLAKTVVLLGLLGLGWWWRRSWVGRAADHRVSADASLRRAVLEVVVMALAFGLAATLAVTA